MKKLVFVAVLAISSVVSAEVRLGSVNLMRLVRNHPDYERNKTLLESTEKDYQKKMDLIKEEGEKLQEEGKHLMDQLNNPMLAAKAKADIEKQLGELQKKLMGVEQRFRAEGLRTRQELQGLEGRLLKSTTDDLKKRISAYAQEKGYDFILDTTVCAYAKESFDVTADILKAMGVDPASAKGEDEDK